MAKKNQREQMFDWLVAHLEGSGQSVVPKRKVLTRSIESSYILVENDGMVFLIDQPYPNDSIREIHRACLENRPNFCPVFLKDGKTFYRSSMAGESGEAGLKSKRFKQKYGLSLKNYGEDELRRMITFRPEERFAFGKSPVLHYYQPSSQNLSEGVVKYGFSNVIFDYSHIGASDGFRPENKASEVIHLWRDRNEMRGNLRLDRRVLVPTSLF